MQSDILGQSFGSVMVPDGIYEGTVTGIKVKFKRDTHGYEFEMLRPANTEPNTAVKIVVSGMKANVYKAS